MLAYAASRSTIAARRSSPNALLVVIGAHVAAVAVLMSAKMDLPPPTGFTRTIVDLIPLPKEPPPPQVSPRVPQPPQAVQPSIARQQPQVPLGPVVDPGLGGGATAIDRGTLAGTGAAIVIPSQPPPKLAPAATGPRLLTSGAELKPPYPASKLLNEEEGVVTVKLTINADGRVTAVEPVGRADPAFLEAARRHLIAHWRYRPASENGHAIASTMTVTLHFELDG